MVLEVLTVGQLDVNCYLVGDPKALLVIDPGDESERILAHIKKQGYHVAYIVLTHCHYDHIGAVSDLVKSTGAKLLIAAKEKENYLSKTVNLCGYFSESCELIEPDDVLEDGQDLFAGDCSFRVISTPGHTSGSICLLIQDCLFSGDTLFRCGIGRTDFPTGNLKALVSSIKDRLFTLDDSIKVYPGHGPSSTISYEKVHNEVYEWERYC